jgi:hypothetical protein
MQNTKYFNMQSFEDYLRQDIKGRSLVARTHGDSKDIYAETYQDRACQFIDSDFLARISTTSGFYNNREGIKGMWEELRVRFNMPVHFSEREKIPAGEYRIIVQAEGGNKPVVRTFKRGLCRWKKENLPNTLPLGVMLNGDLRGYDIKRD